MPMSVQENLAKIQQQLSAHKGVRLVAVTKYATLDQMREAFACGLRDFGENKIQDVERKQQALPSEMVEKVRWHFLGHLQRNKVKFTRHRRFHLIHSIDSWALAEKLSLLNQQDQVQQPVLLQVNITRDSQKSGFLEETLLAEFPRLITLPGLVIQGLMTIGPYPVEDALSRACFCRLRDLRRHLAETFDIPLPELSMGMSQDFHHAIECDATIVRIGDRLFAT